MRWLCVTKRPGATLHRQVTSRDQPPDCRPRRDDHDDDDRDPQARHARPTTPPVAAPATRTPPAPAPRSRRFPRVRPAETDWRAAGVDPGPWSCPLPSSGPYSFSTREKV